MPPDELRRALHRAADMAADYLERAGRYPVLPRIQPGDVRRSLPESPPEIGEPLDLILDDYRRLIEPNVTHWNHPGFFGYFAISGSGPGVIGELLASALNVNAMLWHTGPAPTELEELVCDWLRRMLDLPAGFHGHINDTASIGSLLALAAARHRASGGDDREKGLAGRPDLSPLVTYASEQAHSSIDKAAIALGLGLSNLRRIPTDPLFRMDPLALEAAIATDRSAGRLPIAVVATAGTTSTTSVDPIREIAALCRRERVWLHVDAAYAGSAAICPEHRAQLDGLEEADSIVVNPHKWLFTPVDCSVLLVRDPQSLREAFALVPEYLRTGEARVTNLMDYGVQLGRRFRALKLWMVIRAFGVEGLRERIRAHCAMARALAERIRSEPGWELCAPVPFSVVCFRAIPPTLSDLDPSAQPEEEDRLNERQGRLDKHQDRLNEHQDRFNERLLAAVNAAGPVFLSHTRLNGRFVLRLAIGNIRTTEAHVLAAWDLLRAIAEGLQRTVPRPGPSGGELAVPRA